MPTRMLIGAAAGATLAILSSAVLAQEWHVFGGTYECTGRTVGNSTVRLNCVQEVTRGNRIYTLTPSFTIQGPVAREYLGKHEGCAHVPASETRSNQHFVDCPGIPKWW